MRYIFHNPMLYLRYIGNMADRLHMNLVISDNTRVGYDVPVICMQNYTKDVIFQKKLLEDYGTVPESL